MTGNNDREFKIAFTALVACFLVAPVILTSCGKAKDSSGDPGGAASDSANFPVVDVANLEIATTGTVFVPIHTFLPMGDGEHPLEVTLGIYNTDPKTTLVVSSVRYHNQAGELKKDFLSEAHSLAPMASTKFAIDGSDKGRSEEGSTASFVIEWESEKPINEPVIEAVMARWAGTHAYSFISPGRKVEPAPSGRTDQN